MKSIEDKNRDVQQIDDMLSDMGFFKPIQQESKTEIPASKQYSSESSELVST